MTPSFWFFCVSIISASTQTISLNQSTNDSFWICRLLNEYGCNPSSIPISVQTYINDGTPDDYILPTDRCAFDSINISYIGQHLDLSLLYLVPSSLFVDVPCEVLVQLESELLSAKNVSYLITYDYWFTDGAYLECNSSQSIDCSNSSHLNLNHSTSENAVCYLGSECLYPFVPSKWITDYPERGGMCQCNADCRLRPSLFLEEEVFDTTIDVLCTLCFICLAVYIINIVSEHYQQQQSRRERTKSRGDSNIPTLSVDIPPIIGVALFLFIITFNAPHLSGRRTAFACETQKAWNDDLDLPASATDSRYLWKSNKLCYVFAALVYISLNVIIHYFALLTFCIYRYVAKPLQPLWGLRKRYFHPGVLVLISLLTESFIFMTETVGCDMMKNALKFVI